MERIRFRPLTGIKASLTTNLYSTLEDGWIVFPTPHGD